MRMVVGEAAEENAAVMLYVAAWVGALTILQAATGDEQEAPETSNEITMGGGEEVGAIHPFVKTAMIWIEVNPRSGVWTTETEEILRFAEWKILTGPKILLIAAEIECEIA